MGNSWKFNLLDWVKRETKDFHFTGQVIANFHSLGGQRFCVSQHPRTMQMFVARETDLEKYQPDNGAPPRPDGSTIAYKSSKY